MTGTTGRSGGNRNLGDDGTAIDGTPEPPEGRSKAFYAKWSSLLPTLPAQSLRRVDAVQLAILVEQLVEIDELTTHIESEPADLKARSLRLRICQQVGRMSAQFGLSPADRKRLNFEPEQRQPNDPFTDYMNRRLHDDAEEWA